MQFVFLLSLIYEASTTAQPTYLHSLISVQPPGTRSSSVVTLSRPPTSLKITNRSFRHASPHLWTLESTSCFITSALHKVLLMSHSLIHLPPAHHSPCITHSPFHLNLKTHLFYKSFPPWSASTTLVCLLELLNCFHFLVIFLSFYLGRADADWAGLTTSLSRFL